MIKRIAELCDEGYSRIAIGKALGLPQSTLHKLMRANNLSSHARRGVPYAERKPLLKQYAMDWRMARLPLIGA